MFSSVATNFGLKTIKKVLDFKVLKAEVMNQAISYNFRNGWLPQFFVYCHSAMTTQCFDNNPQNLGWHQWIKWNVNIVWRFTGQGDEAKSE